jgi:hypothetical protein
LTRNSGTSQISSMVSVFLLNGVRSSTCLQCAATPLILDQKRLDLTLTTCHNRLGQGPARLLAHGYLPHPPAIHLRVLALNEMVSLLLKVIWNALTICIERLVNPETRLFKVTEEQRCKFKPTIQRFSSVLDPSFRLPSRHALTRYITSFFRGFHQHLPFIHVPTWNILEHSAETIFGISAIGAQYCFEKKVSEHLFFAGKALLMERLRAKTETLGAPRRSSMASTPSMMQYDTFSGQGQDVPPIDTVRSLITLMAFATWEPKTSLVQEAFTLQGILAPILRDIGLTEERSPSPPVAAIGERDGRATEEEWRIWIAQETSRRSKLIAFSFLHTHSIAYNVYPILRSNEINLRLPCPTKEWKAPNATLWRIAKNESRTPQLSFQEALSLLLRNKNDSLPLEPIPTPLGNYVLLHGLIQRIHIVRDLSLPVMSKTATLPVEEVKKLE